MTPGIHVDVDTSRLEAALERAAASFTAVVFDGLRSCGNLVVKDAKRLAPFRHGNLVKSIKADEPHVSEGGALELDLIAGGAEAFYAPYQEFGTRTIPAKRFMRDALAMHEDDIPEILGIAIENGFKGAGL